MFEFIFLIFCISAKCERRGWLRVEDANKSFLSTASKSQEGVTQTLGILNPCDSLTPAWGESETDLNIHPKPCSAGLDAFGGDRCLGLTLPVLKSRTLLWFHPFSATSPSVFIVDGNHELTHKLNQTQRCD